MRAEEGMGGVPVLWMEIKEERANLMLLDPWHFENSLIYAGPHENKMSATQ